MTPIKLRPASYMVLGMVNLGARSGYAIKKAADISTAAFWPTSLAQVYPELERLEQGGLLVRRDDPQGERRRSSYELTDEGRAALLSWLRSSRQAPTQLRSETMLRLFFADALPRPEQLELVGRLRKGADRRQEGLHEGNLKEAVGGFAEDDIRFPLLVRLLADSLFAEAAEWMAELEAELGRAEGVDRTTADRREDAGRGT
ncbi:MAG TPA: PadR family transcriptional regulator [Solirubrobacterales bacterium]